MVCYYIAGFAGGVKLYPRDLAPVSCVLLGCRTPKYHQKVNGKQRIGAVFCRKGLSKGKRVWSRENQPISLCRTTVGVSSLMYLSWSFSTF